MIERHVDWLGGVDALRGASAMYAEGEIEMIGLSGTISNVFTRSRHFRMDLDLGVISLTEGVSPDAAWERNPSGQIEPMDVAKAARRRQVAATGLFAHLLDPDAFAAEQLEDETLDGRSWSVIRFREPNGDLLDLFLDADGAQGWGRTVQDTDTLLTRFGDWRVVDGVRTPYAMESTGDEPTDAVSIRWRQVSMSPDVDLAQFDRPVEQAQLVHFGEEPADWIGVRLAGGRHIFIDGRLNGVETEFVLDSGAGITVVDRAFADEVGLSGDGAIGAEGTGGTVSATLVPDVRLDVAGVRLDGVTVAVIDLRGMTAQFGIDMSVILGKELFNQAIVDIDYPNHQVRVRNPSGASVDDGARIVPLIPGSSGHRMVELSVEGRAPAPFVLDTGSGGTLTLFEAYAREHGLLDRPLVSSSASGGVGGITVQSLITLDAVEIGGVTLTSVPADIHVEANQGAFDTRDMAGNLGGGILSRFLVTFDYPGERLLLSESSETDRPFRVNRAGLQAHGVDGVLTVLHVQKGSPAEEAGWRPGDTIASVNGESLRGRSSAWRRLVNEPEGTVLHIETADGETRRLILRRFY